MQVAIIFQRGTAKNSVSPNSGLKPDKTSTVSVFNSQPVISGNRSTGKHCTAVTAIAV
jgi:hypothetical protein